MPAKKFRFVSPGVQIKEIDKSQLPASPDAIGPVVIGRTVRGPGMVPVTVGSYEEFVDKFGAPDRGAGSTDVWRNGNTTAPTYAAYAAEAWLRNSTPLTMVRLMGTQHETAIAGSGDAGWATKNVSGSAADDDNGGAYGLFIIPSSSVAGFTNITGSLAAIFYLNEGSIKLSGSLTNGTSAAQSSALVHSVGNLEYKIIVSSGSVDKEIQFNFDRVSSKYVRKVFNTNPTLVNKDITPAASRENYWLGETFETFLKESVEPGDGTWGLLAPLNSGSVKLANFKGVEAQPGKSGWVIGQDLNPSTSSYSPSKMPKLFRFVASEGLGGDWEQNNIKISISDIKYSNNEYEQYGTFTVLVRKIGDTDAAPEVVEAFTNCNLNPKSANYIAAKIGDRYLEWDKTEKRHKELGEYPNMSRYIRVEMNPVIEQGGLDPELLPFGFFGPPKFVSGKLTETTQGEVEEAPVQIGEGDDPEAEEPTVNIPSVTSLDLLLTFPSMQLRVSASDAGTLSLSQAHFGVVPNLTVNGNTLPKVSDDFKDLTRAKPWGVDSYEALESNTATENSFIFTLDDVVITGSLESGSQVYWEKDSRVNGRSFTAIESGSEDWSSGKALKVKEDYSYKDLVDLEFNKFTLPLFGGTDGLNITERDSFRNSLITTDKTERTSSPLYTLRRALDSIKDPEVLNMNLLVLPGITARGVTKYAIDTCESRGDAMAIIDLEGGYEPSSENDKKESERLGSVSETVKQVGQRNLNSSYACAYYPWVKVLDSENGFPLWMPPSVVALGTMASSQENSQVWFAPAGFNRGGLSLGSSGLSVVGVREKLTAKQRDSLYDVNVNPIASFPSEGIVIFGQKTLQAVPSALDRINVRRLVIFLKKQISIVASGLLFEPNVQNTWDRFKRPVTSILEGVKNGLGISDYKLVLDSTTTTPEEIDRNMMYAKLFIKPVYAIEFIGIDFIITNTGASFEDL